MVLVDEFRTTTLLFGEILLASILRPMLRKGGVFPCMSVVVVNPLGYSHRYVILMKVLLTVK